MSQLLCTFTSSNTIDLTVDYISKFFNVKNNCMYLYSEEDNTYNCMLLYNIEGNTTREQAKNTILIHRKKETNTLYTINALNELIKEINNGVLDKTLQINWSNYENILLLYRNEIIMTPIFFEKKIYL